MVEYIDGIIRTLKYQKQESYSGHKSAHFYASSPMTHPGHDVFDFMLYKLVDGNNISLNRLEQVYVNKYPSGESGQGDWHNDFSKITALYYPSFWNSGWGGETLFRDQNVEYKRNRFVIFDQHHGHKGNMHNNPNDFRYTIAFKIDGNIL